MFCDLNNSSLSGTLLITSDNMSVRIYPGLIEFTCGSSPLVYPYYTHCLIKSNKTYPDAMLPPLCRQVPRHLDDSALG